MWVRCSYKLPVGRDWLLGKLGHALVGRALLSKSLIQLSADKWGCYSSLLVVWPDSVLGSIDSMVGLMGTSKRTYANTCLPGLRLPVPLSPWQATADSHLCRRPSNTHRQVCLSLLWSHCSFPLTPGAHNILFLPSKCLSFPQSCGS